MIGLFLTWRHREVAATLGYRPSDKTFAFILKIVSLHKEIEIIIDI